MYINCSNLGSGKLKESIHRRTHTLNYIAQKKKQKDVISTNSLIETTIFFFLFLWKEEIFRLGMWSNCIDDLRRAAAPGSWGGADEESGWIGGGPQLTVAAAEGDGRSSRARSFQLSHPITSSSVLEETDAFLRGGDKVKKKQTTGFVSYSSSSFHPHDLYSFYLFIYFNIIFVFPHCRGCQRKNSAAVW